MPVLFAVNPKGEITELLAKPKQKDGKMFAQVTSLKFINYNTDRVYYQLDNLFNGNKELGKSHSSFSHACAEKSSDRTNYR